MREAASDVWMYGEPENYDLKRVLAEQHGCAPENVVVGEGIDALLGYLVRLLVTEGTPVVTSLGAYPTFNFHVAAMGGQLEAVPFRDDREDTEALISRAAELGASLIYLSNPDNPMGSWHDASTVQAMIDAVPPGALLCLDEAYVEFAPEGTAPPIDVAEGGSGENVIRMRTFSKAYGMAGARVGYAICCAPLATAFDKIRNHFGLSRVSQAGALAALEDEAWLREVVGLVAQGRERIAGIARRNGLTPLPSATNFVTIDCSGEGRGDGFAAALLAALNDRDIFVRMPAVAPQSRCIRIGVGREDEMAVFERALPLAMEAAAAATEASPRL